MLEVRQLTKRYAGIAVVDRVSFTIQPGEILGYLGPNGAGKSTTVKMLIGLIQPNAGHILFDGRDVQQPALVLAAAALAAMLLPARRGARSDPMK